MVVFSCDACGDSLRKKDVQKHYQFNCRRCESLTCVDCKKQFWGDEYAAHTQCITDEDFKYGLSNQHKDEKGQVKQNQWRSNIDVLLSDRSTDKRWTPILLEMQKYENVPRKKKPFMNWCKCTMKRFPYKVVEEVFDKLLELNTQRQQNGGAKKSEEANGDENMDTATNGMNGKESKKLKRKNKTDDGSDEEEEEMELDDKSAPAKKKIKAKGGDDDDDDDEDSKGKESKFKLRKCVAQILVAKGEPVKMKRVLKKVLAEYFAFIEESGTKGKKWTENEISAKVDKLVSANKLFTNLNGTVKLSETGKKKYMPLECADGGDSS